MPVEREPGAGRAGGRLPPSSVAPLDDPNDPVYRARQLAEGGPDPFEYADRPESDPAASAAGEGRKHLDELDDVRAMLARKREVDRAWREAERARSRQRR